MRRLRAGRVILFYQVRWSYRAKLPSLTFKKTTLETSMSKLKKSNYLGTSPVRLASGSDAVSMPTFALLSDLLFWVQIQSGEKFVAILVLLSLIVTCHVMTVGLEVGK